MKWNLAKWGRDCSWKAAFGELLSAQLIWQHLMIACPSRSGSGREVCGKQALFARRTARGSKGAEVAGELAWWALSKASPPALAIFSTHHSQFASSPFSIERSAFIVHRPGFSVQRSELGTQKQS